MSDSLRIPRKKQYACYWSPSTLNNDGVETYGSVAEILVRWDQYSERFIDVDGEETISKALVYPSTDLEIGGLLWQGREVDLPAYTDPREIALPIRGWDKIANPKGNKFLRIAKL